MHAPPGLVPASLVWLFRIGTVVLLLGYFFFVYANVRAMLGAFGLGVRTILLAAGASLIMATMVVFAIGLPELPTLVLGYLLPLRRYARGQCARCGYDRHGRTSACPECGMPGDPPPPYRLTPAAIRRFALKLAACWLIGAIAGELWMLRDEHLFRHQVNETLASAGPTPILAIRRDRTWPASHSWMEWSEEEGFTAGTPFESTRITGWRPTSPGRSAPRS